MKVALAVDNNMITEHFGYCEYFVVYEVSGKEVLGSEIIKNPSHQAGFLPKFLKEHNIDVVIVGNMGTNAVNRLKALNIEYYLGAKGKLVDVLNQYLEGTLVSSDESCNQHMHREQGHHHE